MIEKTKTVVLEKQETEYQDKSLVIAPCGTFGLPGFQLRPKY